MHLSSSSPLRRAPRLRRRLSHHSLNGLLRTINMKKPKESCKVSKTPTEAMQNGEEKHLALIVTVIGFIVQVADRGGRHIREAASRARVQRGRRRDLAEHLLLRRGAIGGREKMRLLPQQRMRRQRMRRRRRRRRTEENLLEKKRNLIGLWRRVIVIVSRIIVEIRH